MSHPAIQALSAHPKLNFWLGPGCSAGLSPWSEADALRQLRRMNPGVDQKLPPAETFASVKPQVREQWRHSAFNGMNWAYLAMADLAAKGRAGAIVLRGLDGLLPRLLAARDVLPSMFEELNGAVQAAVQPSELALFELPLLREPEKWSDALARAAGSNPWVVIGVDKPTAEERAAIGKLGAVYWAPLWDEAAPRIANMQAVPGFDPDSFLFALAHAMTGFLPAGFDAAHLDSIQKSLYAEIETLRTAAHSAFEASGRALDGLEALDDAAFDARMDGFHRAQLKRDRLATMTPNTGGIELYHRAKTVGGRRADRLLALAEDEYRRMPKEVSGFGAALNASQGIRILHDRALLRRHPESLALFQQAHEMLHAMPPGEPRQWSAACDVAGMLSDYAAIKEPPADAEPLVREAVEVLERALNGGPLRPPEERSLWTARITVLRKHAGWLEGDTAAKWYTEVRECCEQIRRLKDEFMYEYHLGILDFEQARKNRAGEEELIEEGNRRFKIALGMNPGSRGLIHMDWGTAIAGVARQREGADADRYFAECFRHYREVSDTADKAYAQVQNNWGAFLLVQARTKSGAEREMLLKDAWSHANLARGIEPASASYNLACIAAERRDWETMTRWLRISARGPRFPSPTHTDSVTSFNPAREEPWFKQLLVELYP